MSDILIPVRVDASQLTKIDAMINQLRGKKINIKLDVDDRLLKIDERLNKLKTLKAKLDVNDKDAIAKVDNAMKKLRLRREAIRIEARLEQNGFNRDIANLQNRKREIQLMARLKVNYGELFGKIQSEFSRVGSVMMTAGNTLRRITAPMEGVLRGMAYGAGYQALNKAVEGLKSGFSRYDTMKKYPLMMAQFAEETYTAEQSIQDLDMSVRGLPTGLDQIVDLSQRFTMSLGDLRRGTRLAIATNRAFLASMATETQQYQGMMQLQDLMNGKKLNSREWMSLGASMGYAMNEIGKVLGYTDSGKFRRELYAGEISTRKFLDALEEVGNEGGVVFEKAEMVKATWQAVAANIQNAFSRMGYNALKALDEVFEIGTGKTFVRWTDELRDGIDNLSESFSGWLKANPDKVLSFFETLRSYDWKGVLTGFGQAAMMAAKTVKPLFDLMLADGGKIGKFMVYGNLVGRALQVFGGAFKGGSYLFAGIATGVRKFVDVVKMLTAVKVGKNSLNAVYTLQKFGKSVKGFTVTTKTIENAHNLGRVGEALSGAALSWQGVANKALSIAAIPAIAGSIWLAAKGLQEMAKIDISWPKLVDNILQMGTVIATFGTMAAGIGAVIASTNIGKITALSSALGLGALSGISGTIKLMASAMKDLAEVEVPDKTHLKQLAGSLREIMPEIHDIVTLFDRESYNISGAKSTARNTDSVFESISGIITSLGDVAKADIRVADIKSAVGKISTLEEVMGDIDNTIYNLFRKEKKYTNQDPRSQGTKNQVTDLDVENFAKISANYSTIFTNIKSTLDNISGFRDKFAELKSGKGFGGKGKFDLTEIKEPIENMLTQLKELKPSFKQLSNLNKEFKDIKLDNLNQFDGLTKIFEGIESFRNQFVEMKEGKGFGGKGSLDLGVITDEIEQLAELFGGEDEKHGLNAIFNKLGRVSDHFGDFDTDAVSKAFEGLKNIFSAIEGFRQEYAPMVSGDSYGGEGELSFEKMRGRISTIADFLTSLSEEGKDGEASITEALTSIGETFGAIDIEPVHKAFSNLKTVIEKMAELQTAATESGFITEGEGGATPLQGIETFVSTLGDSLNTMGDKLAGLEEKFSDDQVTSLGNVKQAFIKIKEIANEIGSEGVAEPVNQIKKAIDEIKNIDWTGMQIPPINISVQINLKPQLPIDTTAVTSAVWSKIGEISGELTEKTTEIEKTVKVQLKDDVVGKKAVVNAVERAIDDVRSRINALPSTITKTITVRIVRETYTTGGLHTTGGTLMESSTGGLVPARGTTPLYRAGGGSIFKPRGTDTVPAMLTPGEYVSKRAVVNKLGVPFFQRLNNLDIPGALRELSIRTGMSLGGGTVINNYNNTTNNTTNNISVPVSGNDSQNFTMRRLGRFAGAL